MTKQAPTRSFPPKTPREADAFVRDQHGNPLDLPIGGAKDVETLAWQLRSLADSLERHQADASVTTLEGTIKYGVNLNQWVLRITAVIQLKPVDQASPSGA